MKRNQLLIKAVISFTLIILSVLTVHAQGFFVKGKVSDDQGNPIVGANVIIRGSQNGTITDANGLFSIKVDSGKDLLVFSFIGYDKSEISVGDQTEINVTLVSSVTSLSEIIVMGYSEKKKSEITSAVSTISGDQMKDVVSADMTTMLQGKIAGAQITTSSGQPGQAAEIRIRGTSTFTGNGLPLYVIDGIPAGQEDPGIDPNMIESVTILKDAGSTGMFGSKANSGVVVITTKKGTTEKAKFEFSANYGYKTPEFNNFSLMSAEELKQYRKAAYIKPTDYSFNVNGFKAEWPDSIKTSKRNFNWLKAVYKPAYVRSFSLSVSGKTDKYNYFIGGTYYNEDGTFIKTGFEKFSLRSNNNFKFTDRLSFNANIEINASKQKYNDWRSVTYSIQNNPLDNPYGPDGNLILASQSNPKWISHWQFNGLQYINNTDFYNNHIDNTVDLGLNVKILPWLTFTSNNRLSYYSSWNYNIYDPRADCEFASVGGQNQTTTSYGASMGSTDLLKFNKSYGKHNISGLVGVEAGYSYNEIGMGGLGQGLVEGYESLGTVSNPLQLSGYSIEQAGESFISQVNYNFEEKYFLSGSYRIDKDSRFAPKARMAAFPTISGSWLLSKEDFIKNYAMVDNLKLRVSYGLTGNNNIGPNLYLAKYGLSLTNYGSTSAIVYNGGTGAIPIQLDNSELSWERTTQINIGFDLGLFKRFELNVDYYNKTTNNLLIQKSQVLSTGYESAWTNFGKVYNQGIEINLSGSILKTTNLNWTAEFNISKNTNKVGGLGTNVIQQNIDNVIEANIDGQPVWSFYGPKWLGVDPATGNCLWEQITKAADGTITKAPTATFSNATNQIIGNPWPDFQGGIGTALKYRMVTFNINFAFSKGSDVYNLLRRDYDNDGKDRTLNQQKFINGWSRWEKPGDIATHPFFNAANRLQSNLYSSRYLEDGSFIKLRSASLSFDLPTKWVKNTVQDLVLTFSGNNLFTWTKFSGIDPEASLANTGYTLPGVSNTYVYPLSRQFLATLKFKF